MVVDERLKMTRNGEEERIKGGGMIAFAWFVWEKNYGHSFKSRKRAARSARPKFS